MNLTLFPLLACLSVLVSSIGFAKERETFSPNEAILEVVHHFKIEIDLSQKLIYRGDVLFSPLGQLGAYAVSMKEKPGLFIFETYRGGSARLHGLKKWDQIISVNGKKLGTIDGTNDEGPIVIFGLELDKAEGRSMKLELEIKRDGEPMPITINLKRSRGTFETSDPLTGSKGQKLMDQALKELKDSQTGNGLWKCGYGSEYTSYLAGLALLSTGDPKHLTEIKKCARACMKIDEYNWTWGLAMNTIFLSEYFWATGDILAYRKLEELSEELSKCVGPTGGIGHKYTAGTYDSDSFGAPSVLCQLAWSACAQCLVAVDNESRTRSFHRILGNPHRTDSNNVNYGGSAYRGGLGESAFRTSAYGLSLGLSRWEPKVYRNIISLLEKDYRQFRYIHSTPSQGTIFSALCLAQGSKSGYDEYLNYVKWRLTVAWEDDKTIHYIHPKKARYNFPGGGGWGGDSVIGFKNLSLIETIIILNAKKRKLLMQGNREMGWMTKKDSEETKADIYALHHKEYARALKQAESYVRSGQPKQAMKFLSGLENKYSYTSTRAKLQEVRSKLEDHREWETYLKRHREKEAAEYLEWAIGLRTTVRKKYLLQLIEYFPETHAAHKATIMLKTEEKKAKDDAKNKKKEKKQEQDDLEKQKKEEEKRKRRMKKP